jgi:hypothetical protein
LTVADRADGLIPHIAAARQRFRAYQYPDPLRDRGIDTPGPAIGSALVRQSRADARFHRLAAIVSVPETVSAPRRIFRKRGISP